MEDKALAVHHEVVFYSPISVNIRHQGLLWSQLIYLTNYVQLFNEELSGEHIHNPDKNSFERVGVNERSKKR